MNMVFLVRNYSPLPNAVGVCAEKIVEYLKNNYPNNKYIVICEKNDSNQLESEVVDNVEVNRFLTSETFHRLFFYNLSKSPVFYMRITGIIVLFLLRLFYLIRDVFYPVSAKRQLIEAYYDQLRSLNLNDGDVVVPFSAPFETIIASCNYYEKISHLKLIPILYDLFSDCPYLNRNNFLKKIKYKNNKLLEEKMVRFSRIILCPAYWEESLKNFPDSDKIRIADVPLIKDVSDCIRTSKEIVYCGSFQKRIRKSDFICKVIDELLQTNSFDYSFRFIGNGSQDRRLIKLRTEYPERIILDGYLPHENAISIMKSALCLIVVGNERNNQSPSKVFECMSLKKPIVYFTKSNTEDIVDSYLKLYNNAFVFRENADITSQICEFRSFLNSATKRIVTYQEIKNIFFMATPEYYANNIFNCLNS